MRENSTIWTPKGTCTTAPLSWKFESGSPCSFHRPRRDRSVFAATTGGSICTVIGPVGTAPVHAYEAINRFVKPGSNVTFTGTGAPQPVTGLNSTANVPGTMLVTATSGG